MKFRRNISIILYMFTKNFALFPVLAPEITSKFLRYALPYILNALQSNRLISSYLVQISV